MSDDNLTGPAHPEYKPTPEELQAMRDRLGARTPLGDPAYDSQAEGFSDRYGNSVAAGQAQMLRHIHPHAISLDITDVIKLYQGEGEPNSYEEPYQNQRLLTDVGYKARWENYRRTAGLERRGDDPWQVDELLKLADADVSMGISVLARDLEQAIEALTTAQEALTELLVDSGDFAADLPEDTLMALRGALDTVNEAL